MCFCHNNSLPCALFLLLPCVLLAVVSYSCLKLVAAHHFLLCGVVQKTTAVLRRVVPFDQSFPTVVTLPCSARNCLHNRCGVA